jgi:hypothetical protein
MVAQSRAQVAGDYYHLRWIDAPRGADHRVNHGAASHRVEHFQQAGMHPRALACRQDNHRATTAAGSGGRRFVAIVCCRSIQPCRGVALPRTPLFAARLL